VIYLIDKQNRPATEDRYALLIQPKEKHVVLGAGCRVIWEGEDLSRAREYLNNLRELERKRA